MSTGKNDRLMLLLLHNNNDSSQLSHNTIQELTQYVLEKNGHGGGERRVGGSEWWEAEEEFYVFTGFSAAAVEGSEVMRVFGRFHFLRCFTGSTSSNHEQYCLSSVCTAMVAHADTLHPSEPSSCPTAPYTYFV